MANYGGLEVSVDERAGEQPAEKISFPSARQVHDIVGGL